MLWAHKTAIIFTTLTDWLQGILADWVTSLIIQHHFLSPLLYKKKIVHSFDVFCSQHPISRRDKGTQLPAELTLGQAQLASHFCCQATYRCEQPRITPLLKGLDRLVSVSYETVSTLHTLVPRQTSLCRWQSIILGPFWEKHQKCGYKTLFPYSALKVV